MAGRNGVERVGNSASKNRGKNRPNNKIPFSTSPTAFFNSPPKTMPQQPNGYVHARHNSVGGRGSPKSPGIDRFAGAKWTEPPSPTALPQPPIHWTKPDNITRGFAINRICDFENSVARPHKFLLKSQA